MTDQEYIQAFASDDQKGMREAYFAMRDKFFAHICAHCTHFNTNYLEDAYVEAFLRLQTNVLSGRLTKETLTSSLQTYINSIGFYVAMEMAREQKEVVEGTAAWQNIINQLDLQASQEDAESRYGMQALWIYEVENAFAAWCTKNPGASTEEKYSEYDRLTDAFADNHSTKGGESVLPDFFSEDGDTMQEILQLEREKLIRTAVEEMGEPCATILIGSYWNNETADQLAEKLKYSGPETARNQKSRCMKRLKDSIRKTLRINGYDY